MRDFTHDQIVGFRRSFTAGVVREPRWHAEASQSWATMAALCHPRQPSIPAYPSFEQSAQQPGTLVHWEQSFALQTHPGPAPYGLWVIEVARHGCGDSETAVIKSFEQVYRLERETELSCPWWGDPYRLWPDRIRWHFRTESWTGAFIPQWQALGAVDLPGDPHRETPVFDDLWFPAGSPTSQNIHVTIGSRTILRVLAEVPASSSIPYVAAKIRGFGFRAFAPVNIPALKTIW